MVQSEVYLNKYVASIAPFSTPACPDCSQHKHRKLTGLLCMFRFLNFHPFSRGVDLEWDKLTSFAPMCGRPCRGHVEARGGNFISLGRGVDCR